MTSNSLGTQTWRAPGRGARQQGSGEGSSFVPGGMKGGIHCGTEHMPMGPHELHIAYFGAKFVVCHPESLITVFVTGH